MALVARDVNREEAGTPAEQVRQDLRAYMERAHLSQGAVARRLEMAPGRLSEWLSGKYGGDNDKVAELVERFLAATQARPEPAVSLPAREFVATEASANVIGAVTYARLVRGMAIVWGDPGVGKTMALEQYRETHPGEVVWVTGAPHHRQASALLDDLIVAAGLPAPGNGAGMRAQFATLVAALAGEAERLVVIIDEAQHLSLGALEELRTLYDATRVPIVLAGNDVVYGRLHGRGQLGWAQLFSRMALQCRVPREIPEKDVRAIAVGVDELGVAFLTKLALGGGSLRAVTNCLRIARLIAADGGRQQPNLKDWQGAAALLMPGA
jgi:hypothetical protein